MPILVSVCTLCTFIWVCGSVQVVMYEFVDVFQASLKNKKVIQSIFSTPY